MTAMTLLLTISSVIAVWALLQTLVLGLLLVFKSLVSIGGIFESIAFGVRAIERETAPVESLPGTLTTVSNEVTASLQSLTHRFTNLRSNT